MARITLALAGCILIVTASSRGDDEHFICRIESTLPSGEKLEFTGFKVKGVSGIYTALHGVHGSKQLDAIFHDPKTRRVRMQLSEADVDRDIALLVPNGSDALPSGGLGLGVWPPKHRLDAQLGGQSVTVLGYPLGIDLKCATTRLRIRKPAVAELTELINPSARIELSQRGSPKTSQRMLSLQGEFLPGHSGAPILDADSAVIGIGIGGLDEGRVGHGWAAPFHEVQLRPITDPTVRQRLATLPTHQKTYSFSLVVDDAVRQQPDRMSLVSTTVESDDGSPILALRRSAGEEVKNEVKRLGEILKAIRNGEHDKYNSSDEFKRIMRNRLYLPSGTAVDILGNSQKLKLPAGIPADEENMRHAMNRLFTRVRVIDGTSKGEELWVPTVAIRRRAGNVTVNSNNQNVSNSNLGNIKIGDFNVKVGAGGKANVSLLGDVTTIEVNKMPLPRKKQVLNNNNVPTLVLVKLGNDPLRSTVEPSNHLGIVPVGTEVRLLGEEKSVNPFWVFSKIEILTGKLKGKTGWVSKNTIRTVETK